jgi:hypothetical protein
MLKNSLTPAQTAMPNVLHQQPNNQMNTISYPTLAQPIMQNKINPYYANMSQPNTNQNIPNQYQPQSAQPGNNENLVIQNYQNSYQSPPNYHQFQNQPPNFSSTDNSNELPNAVMQFV